MLPPTRRHGRRSTPRSVKRARQTGRDAVILRRGRAGRDVHLSHRWHTTGGTFTSSTEGSRWSFVGPIALVSGLFGASTGMVMGGLAAHLDTVFAGLAREYILAGAFLALGAGVRVPQRLTMWVCALVWERIVARHGTRRVSDLLEARGATDRPLYWIVLSGIALTAGIMIALLPKCVELASACYVWLNDHFVWSALPLHALHLLIAFGVGLPSLMLLGLALSCAHHMSCRYGRWDVRATGWHLLGAAVGTTIVVLSGTLRVSPGLLLVGSSVPALLVAVLAAGVFSRSRDNGAWRDHDTDALPARSDRWPTLLRAGIVVVGGSAALCAVMASDLLVAAYDVHGVSRGVIVPFALSALGAGVLLGCRFKPPGMRTLHGFGVCALSCGGVTAAVSLTLAQARWFGSGINVVATGAMLAVFGFTTGYGRQLLMASVARRSSEGSKMTSRLLICVALAIGIGVPMVRGGTCQVESLVLSGMMLVALGGWLLTRDPTGVPRRDRMRSGAIVVSLAMLAVLVTWKQSPWRTGIAQVRAAVLKTHSFP